ncbi:MAG: toxin-antitoxin system toxin subunit [Verrucomicrobia bacterium]|nr:MAG: toxin-antitoxin system toxin subunit [Verrucomicrobiota bacterium]
MLSQIFSSKTKAGIFHVLFGMDLKELHSREIMRQTGMSLASVQQELKRLESLDLIERRKDGNRVYFKANQSHPLFNDLRQLTLKTSGIVPMLREALKPIADQIDYAFVFGSIARSEEKAHSDVDVMVIGTLGLRKITSVIGLLASSLEREINPHVQTMEDFMKRLQEGDMFIRNIAVSEKLFIMGDEHAFGAMVQERMA